MVCFQSFAYNLIKISNDNSTLQKRLFFKQIGEVTKKQRKISNNSELPPMLSTGSVDSFFLETDARSLQDKQNHGQIGSQTRRRR
ncbi:MAG: hypothetical protein CML59_01825 [Rhodobacteraceae bacterium]|nr:hypothetical protein [Paracoccaceae bacterium]